MTIIRDFIGGEQGQSDVGTGNLVDIFNAAADIWERTILDEHVLVLHFGWAPNGGGEHFLQVQGGTPNRETEGTILLNNDNVVGHHHFYLDPTPCLNEEYQHFTETSQNLGGGEINIGRVFTDPTGDANSLGEDLLSIVLHEIGHALGMSVANTSFIAEASDGEITVTEPRPFAGTALELTTNNAGVTSHFDGTQLPNAIMTGQQFFQRQLPSGADILAMAQLSQFTNLNLDAVEDGNCVVTVAIDILPDSASNSINAGRRGEIPVAILTTDAFDASTVDILSIRFGPGQASETHARAHLEDVNGDGRLDVVAHFSAPAAGLVCGSAAASVEGWTVTGQKISGSDVVRMIGCKVGALTGNAAALSGASGSVDSDL